MTKRDKENKQEINIETYLKKKKFKKENTEKNRYNKMFEEKKIMTKIISRKLL